MSPGPREGVPEFMYAEAKTKLTQVLDGEHIDEFFALCFFFYLFSI